jgi:hypothetical protein
MSALTDAAPSQHRPHRGLVCAVRWTRPGATYADFVECVEENAVDYSRDGTTDGLHCDFTRAHIDAQSSMPPLLCGLERLGLPALTNCCGVLRRRPVGIHVG